jgi:KDO2-lipid IV(A) lauroyltransferase
MRFLLLSAIFRLISLLPVQLQRGLSHPLGYLAWVLSKTKRNSTLKNLAACYPELSAAEREELGKASMRHYVLIALETGISWYWSRSRLLSLFDEPAGREYLDRAREVGRGVLILVPHLGTWELLNQWMQTECELVSLYKSGRYPDFEEKLLNKRKRFGGELVPTSRAGLKVFVRFLKAGETALLLPDQDPSEGQGRFAPFFGIPALTGVLASRLAQQTGCRVVFAVAKRAEKGRFQVHIEPAEEAFYSPDIDTSLAALNRGVERCIAIDPEQYLWAYKRFKSRPEGEPRFY